MLQTQCDDFLDFFDLLYPGHDVSGCPVRLLLLWLHHDGCARRRPSDTLAIMSSYHFNQEGGSALRQSRSEL